MGEWGAKKRRSSNITMHEIIFKKKLSFVLIKMKFPSTSQVNVTFDLMRETAGASVTLSFFDSREFGKCRLFESEITEEQRLTGRR